MTMTAVCTEKGQVLTQAVVRAAEIFRLNQKELGAILGISPSSISRMYKGTYCLRESQKEWQIGLLFVRLFRGLDAICGGDESSLRGWFRNYNTDLGAVPEELVATIQGLVNAADYVDAYRAKA